MAKIGVTVHGGYEIVFVDNARLVRSNYLCVVENQHRFHEPATTYCADDSVPPLNEPVNAYE